MSARDDYPALYDAACYYLHRDAGTYEPKGRQMLAALDEIDLLRRWKAEAMLIMAEWDEVWEAAGRPGPLGKSKARIIQQVLLDNQPER
jgi:hypothetical protein